ncbi:unnamed protein product, partial [Meganyctiphanes norvegica]
MTGNALERPSPYSIGRADNMDDLLTGVGFGPWQFLSMLAVFCIQGSYSSQHVATVFTNMPLNFRCLPSYNKESSNSTDYDNNCHHNYNTNSSHKNSMEVCRTFEYNTTVFHSTFTSEFNLVCEKAWLSNLYKTMGFTGVIVGCAFTGLGDKWGRVTILRVVTVLYVSSTLLVGLSTNVFVIIASRFVIGFCYEMLNGSAYTLMMEILPPHYRSPVGGIMSNIANTIFTLITGGVSYFIRDWRILHLVLSFPIYLLVPIVLFLDKSPRWLIINNRTVEAIAVLEKAAKMNKSEFPEREKVVVLSKECVLKSSCKVHKTCCEKLYSKFATLKTLFGSPGMRIISLIFPLASLLTANVYYTIPLNANNSSNPFLYIIIIGIADIPPNLFAPFLMNKLGNINAGCVTYSITLLCLVSLVFVPESLWSVQYTFVIIAMMMISVNYMICYVMSSELFPTVVRSAGFGIGAFCKHSGVLIASNLIDLAQIVNMIWLPNAVSAGCCLLASLVIRLLPETKGKFLCDTVEDVEHRRHGLKNKSFKYEHVY